MALGATSSSSPLATPISGPDGPPGAPISQISQISQTVPEASGGTLFGVPSFGGGVPSNVASSAAVLGIDEGRPASTGAPLGASVGATTGAEFTSVISNVTGAYFRKILSPAGVANVGIEGTIQLPVPHFDPERNYVSPRGLDDFHTGPLDIPDVYFGGTAAGHELDVGLSWDRVYDAQGRPTYTDLEGQTDGREAAHRFVRAGTSAAPSVIDGSGAVVASGAAEVQAFMAGLIPNAAYRVYWRTTNGGGNQWHNPPTTSPSNVYFYPGETIAMRLVTTGPGQMLLSIDGPSGLEVRQPFAQDGFGNGSAPQFKRVVSIDQFVVGADGQRKGNEGGAVVLTSTTLDDAKWERSAILQAGGAPAVPIYGPAFSVVIGRDTAAAYGDIFHRSNITSVGSETLSITPPA